MKGTAGDEAPSSTDPPDAVLLAKDWETASHGISTHFEGLGEVLFYTLSAIDFIQIFSHSHSNPSF